MPSYFLPAIALIVLVIMWFATMDALHMVEINPPIVIEPIDWYATPPTCEGTKGIWV